MLSVFDLVSKPEQEPLLPKASPDQWQHQPVLRTCWFVCLTALLSGLVLLLVQCWSTAAVTMIPSFLTATTPLVVEHNHLLLRQYRERYPDLADCPPMCGGDKNSQQSPTASHQPPVVRSRPGFPSYLDYASSPSHAGSIRVTYDARSLRINDDPVLLLGGSLHPVRATRGTWDRALDAVVQNGLNLVTMYIMWSAHQPLPNQPLNWTFPDRYPTKRPNGTGPGCQCPSWDLAQSVRAAARRGLWVHIRIGPYVCAEYNYGGIPEWVPLQQPGMAMRRPNAAWMHAMRDFVNATVQYLTEQRLFAYQGGPIIMAQIENELGEEVQDVDVEAFKQWLLVDSRTGKFVEKEANLASTDLTSGRFRSATVQDYADWCGSLVQNLTGEHVVWTMCYGLYANNTLPTSNAVDVDVQWMAKMATLGQPMLLTEFEGGFQIWGDDSQSPSNYFWGQSARAMANNALRWFARGGCHLNYYMFFGGYNRGRAAGAGIMNLYASDVPVCPSGEPHQPKYDHFMAMHNFLADAASILVNAPSAIFQNESLEVMDSDGVWHMGDKQWKFEYAASNGGSYRRLIFVENDADSPCVVRVPISHVGERPVILQMSPYTVVVMLDGQVRFNSSHIPLSAMSYERLAVSSAPWQNWTTVEEPIGALDEDPRIVVARRPVEQTQLMVNSNISSDYAWYETDLKIETALQDVELQIDAQEANAFAAFIDGAFAGAADIHQKKEGNVTISITIGHLNAGQHRLALLSESLGYFNLIGRWGASTAAKSKGITGDVVLVVPETGMKQSLVDGRDWRSFAGLHRERFLPRLGHSPGSAVPHNPTPSASSRSTTWTSVLFPTPNFNPQYQSLYVQVREGRGHLWLNGNDLGRYWNITRGNMPTTYSQSYYQLPFDYLSPEMNELLFFDVFGGDHKSTELVVSWIAPSEDHRFQDEVDFPLACLYN